MIAFHELPVLTCIWRVTLTPCVSPYVHGTLTSRKSPDGYNWYDAASALKTHFDPPESDMRYQPERVFWAFMTVKYLMDFDYGGYLRDP